MKFAVAESTNRPFEDVCAALCDENVLQAVGATPLQADTDALVSIGPQLAVLRARWRDRSGCSQLTAQIRVVGVNRGAEPVTELLMIGHATAGDGDRRATVAWAHRVLAALAALAARSQQQAA